MVARSDLDPEVGHLVSRPSNYSVRSRRRFHQSMQLTLGRRLPAALHPELPERSTRPFGAAGVGSALWVITAAGYPRTPALSASRIRERGRTGEDSWSATIAVSLSLGPAGLPV